MGVVTASGQIASRANCLLGSVQCVDMMARVHLSGAAARPAGPAQHDNGSGHHGDSPPLATQEVVRSGRPACRPQA
jgi:hypothetical protein